MRPVYVYPASFCPPTYGHYHTLAKAVELFGRVTLVCSTNSNKTNQWFSPEESKYLWNSYPLPSGVQVVTFSEFVERGFDAASVVMVRGIRDEADAEYEKKVMLLNKQKFRIDKFVYLFSGDEYKDISSSKARAAAEKIDFEEMSRCVSPLVVTSLLERTLGIKNLFMVVGRPGSGKSTFLRSLTELDPTNVWVNTDDFSHQLKHLLVEKFGENDLVKLALEKEAELLEAISNPWKNLLRDSLKKLPKGCNAFVEVPFGMQLSKRMFRFLGGKVLCLSCGRKLAERRIEERGTPHVKPFLESIPNLAETKRMVKQHKLLLCSVQTNFSLSSTRKTARKFNSWLKKENEEWMMYSPGSCLDIWSPTTYCKVNAQL